MTLRDRLQAIRAKRAHPLVPSIVCRYPCGMSPFVRRALEGKLPAKVFSGGAFVPTDEGDAA